MKFSASVRTAPAGLDRWRASALVGAILLALAAAVPAQIPSAIQKAVSGGEAKAGQAAANKPEDIQKRLEQWHQEARESLSRIEGSASAGSLPQGITPAEIDARRRDLEQMVLVTTSALKNLNATAEARKALEAARAADSAWTGFKESPPFSILMTDELLNERDAVQAELRSHQSSLANFERLLATSVGETRAADEAASAALLALQNAAADQEDGAKWRLEAAREKARLQATRAGYIQASCDALKERIAASEVELALITRKAAAAVPHTVFSDEDESKLEKIANERKRAADRELAAVSKRTKAALAARSQAQAALKELAVPTPGDPLPPEVELARFRVEVADARIDSLQSITESLESLVQLENVIIKGQKDRRTAMTQKDPAERQKALDALALLYDRLRAWLNVLENEMGSTGAELSKIESRAASIPPEDPRFPLLNDQRASRSEKLAMLQRSSQAVDTQRKIVRRWINDLSPKKEQTGTFHRINALAANSWEMIGTIWNFKLMTFEDKVEVDGQTITGKIPITLGMLLRAIAFFLVGYWIASRIANRIQHGVVSRGHIAEAQAKTLRNWAMIAVGVVLVISTLSFLKIPLTVFAFLGGALAIGIGFGTQTLIKNFISGIIVLAERKVRVGDTLDVDGIIGTVTEVNTRSSIIRGPDDVETMIPNSLFLENRVTNLTLSSAKVRRSVRVGTAYGTDPKLVMEILTESASRHGLICKDPAPFTVFDDFGDNALMFTLYFWVEMSHGVNAMVVASDLRLMIEKRFSEAKIGIPFPQRDLHLTASEPLQVQMTEPSGR